jgi:large subunit ribosomal protein L7/L12
MTITNEQIAARAYERFVARGHQHGHDVEDWIAAEADLKRAEESKRSGRYDIVLVDPGTSLIEVVRHVRELTGLKLQDVQVLIDSRPRAIKRAVPRAEAEALEKKLTAAGARIRLELTK